MPIDIDIREHELLGPMLQAEIQKGELTIVQRVAQKRFGALPGWVAENWLPYRRPNSKI